MEDSGFRQTTVLARRYLDVLMGDTVNTTLLLLQTPILAMVISLAFGDVSGDMSVPLAQRIAAQQHQIRFALALAAIWCGTTNAAREICKERPIYLRERMVNLKIESYVLSKIVILLVLSLIQCSILLGLTHWLSPQGVHGDLIIMFFVLILISLAGITLGLLISAAVDNPDRAITLVPVVLMPQIMFSGMNVPVEEMQSWSKFISNFMVVRWSVSLLEKLWMRRLSSAFFNELIVLIVFILLFTVLSMLVLNFKEMSFKRAAAPRKVPKEEAVICSVCSRKIISGRKECPHCGTAFHIQCIANYCPVCGAPAGKKPTFRRVRVPAQTVCPLDGKIIQGEGMMCPYCESIFHIEDVQGRDTCPICNQ
ncbi:MAG: ABC transporter permease [Theionarchaea archaeon]|nr:ABC transporter permease [Theionarchaea archaeon]